MTKKKTSGKGKRPVDFPRIGGRISFEGIQTTLLFERDLTNNEIVRMFIRSHTGDALKEWMLSHNMALMTFVNEKRKDYEKFVEDTKKRTLRAL